MCTLNTQPPLFITPKPFHSVRLHSGFLSNLHFGPRQKLAPLGLQVVLRASPFPPCLRKKVQRILESSSSSPQTQILLGDRLPSRKCKVCVCGGGVCWPQQLHKPLRWETATCIGQMIANNHPAFLQGEAGSKSPVQGFARNTVLIFFIS